MKKSYLLPPLAAILLSAFYLHHQKSTIETLEKKSNLLKVKIASVKNQGSEMADKKSNHASEKSDTAKGKPAKDWKKFIQDVVNLQAKGEIQDVKTMIRIQEDLLSMSKEEILDAFAQEDALNLTDQEKKLMHEMLFPLLAEKDPDEAMQLYITKIKDLPSNSSGMFLYTKGILPQVFGKWTEKNPTAALAWLDQEVAKGTFESKSLDGKDSPRMNFEAMILKSMVLSDPATIEKRISAMNDSDKNELFKNSSLFYTDDNKVKVIVALARKNLTEEQQSDFLTKNISSRFTIRGYDKANEYLTLVDAKPAERAKMVEFCANNIIEYNEELDKGHVDEYRNWVKKQAPDVLDRATGKVLENSIHMEEYLKYQVADAIKLANQYLSEGAGDTMILPLLDSYKMRDHKKEARELAEKITDEKLRNEYLKKIK